MKLIKIKFTKELLNNLKMPLEECLEDLGVTEVSRSVCDLTNIVTFTLKGDTFDDVKDGDTIPEYYLAVSKKNGTFGYKLEKKCNE